MWALVPNPVLTPWSLYKMTVILQTTFATAFSRKTICVFAMKFPRNRPLTVLMMTQIWDTRTMGPLFNISALNAKYYMVTVSSCTSHCPIHCSQLLSREWRCCWSSADRQNICHDCSQKLKHSLWYGSLGITVYWCLSELVLNCFNAEFRFVPSQWETVLLCDVSHWLGASLESALSYISCIRVSSSQKNTSLCIANHQLNIG